MTRVIYVLGWQRSGTTVLGNILGNASDACHIGELTYLFTPEHPARGICGCGEPLTDCALWGDLLRGVINPEWRRRANQARLRSVRMRHVPQAVLRWRTQGMPPEYARWLSQAYTLIQQASSCRTIIDSSKTPGECLAAVAAPGVDTYVLHVVRDPRGCAYSTSARLKPHREGEMGTLERKSPLRSSVRWLETNALAELLARATPRGRYLRVRYEDLTHDPVASVHDIAQWAGLDDGSIPMAADGSTEVSASHTVMGNPNRHDRGTVVLSPDQEWVGAMSTREKVEATLPGLPLLARYRYPLRQQDTS